MATYYKNRPTIAASVANVSKDKSVSTAEAPALSEYDKHRLTLLSDDAEEGWASELRRYLGKVQHDVEKDTDIVEWWQVSFESSTNISAHYFER
jgi:hypothetical protein